MGRKQNGFVVGTEAAGDFAGRMEGQAFAIAPAGRHYKDIKISIAVRSECNAFTIVTPHRSELVRFTKGQRTGRAAGGRDRIDIALVFEKDGLAIGRNGRVPKPQRIFLTL